MGYRRLKRIGEDMANNPAPSEQTMCSMYDSDALCGLALTAGEPIDDNFNVEAKSSDIAGDLVTSLDLKIEDFLVDKIQQDQTYDTFAIISEERYSQCDKLPDNYITIDPIDGTINFAHHLPLWGIQMACVRDGKPSASVIYLPALKELYFANALGTFLNNKDHPVHVNSYGISEGICDVEGHLKQIARPQVLEHVTHIRDLNSTAVAMAWVACGRLSAVGYFGGDDIYNYLPGVYLVQQAGGRIFDHHNRHFVTGTSSEFMEMFKGIFI